MAIAPISRLGRAWAFAVGIGVVTLLAAPLVFHAFYTTFQEYDDEGYLLISLRDYARGGVLYDEVFKPRLAYLTRIIATLLDCSEDDDRVLRCLMSVNAQLLALLDTVAKKFRLGPPLAAEDVPTMARHITCFSLAGIRAIANR